MTSKRLCGGQKSMANIKAAGKYRQEGRNYVMQDGDIVHFMFNVTASGKKKQHVGCMVAAFLSQLRFLDLLADFVESNVPHQ